MSYFSDSSFNSTSTFSLPYQPPTLYYIAPHQRLLNAYEEQHGAKGTFLIKSSVCHFLTYPASPEDFPPRLLPGALSIP